MGCPAEDLHSGRAVCGGVNTRFLIPAGALGRFCGMGQSALPGPGICSTRGSSQIPNHRKKLVMVLQNRFVLSFRIFDFDFPMRLWSGSFKSTQKFSQRVHV